MPASETELRYQPTSRGVEVLRERLLQMGVSISEPTARRLLEAVLAIEGPRLESQSRALQTSLETIRQAAQDALNALQGKPAELPRREYELSFPPPEPTLPASGPRRRIAASHPPAPPSSDLNPGDVDPEDSNAQGPRPVFRRRRGR